MNRDLKIPRVSLQYFDRDEGLLQDSEWLLVVKSQDQTVRRNRLLSKVKNGRYGRTESRPTAIGLLANVFLHDGQAQLNWKKEFPEPRHIIRLCDDVYALTDVSGVNVIDKDGEVSNRINDPLYAFLHSIDQNELKKDKILVCSSGYDAIIETNIKTEERSFLWSAWENGFNPDENGNWLALTDSYHEHLVSEGKKSLLIEPEKYGEQGINTKFRSAHPNVAVYNPYKDNSTMIVSIGHGGTLYEVDLISHKTSLVFDELSEMPHGLMPYKGGWLVTNTTKGEVWSLSANFEAERILSLRELPGKNPDLGSIEWIQNTKVTSDGLMLCLDANRGLVAIDVVNKKYNVFHPDMEWCLQDGIILQ